MAILLVAASLAPGAAAAPIAPKAPACLELPRDGGLPPCVPTSVPFLVPCLDLHVHTSVQKVDLVTAPPVCNWPKVRLDWNATPHGGRGEASFEFDSEGVDPPNATVGAFGKSSQRSAAAPHVTVVVRVSFEAHWGGDCGDARGSASASVNDAPAQADAPRDLFRSLCRLSTGTLPADVQTVLSTLSSFAGALLPREAPALPAPPSHEESAQGDLVAGVVNSTPLVEESHDAFVSTPLGNLSSSGEFRLAPLPARADGPRLAKEQGPLPRPSPDAPARPSPRAIPVAAEGLPAANVNKIPALPDGEAAMRVHAVAAPSGSSLAPGLRAAAVGSALAILLLAAGLALHHRISRGKALDHPARAALHRACQDFGRPATVSQLAQAAKLSRRAAEHHLLYLARLGILRRDAAAGSPQRFALATHARSPAPRSLKDDLLALVRAKPGLFAAEAAEALGVGRLRVDRRVKDLLLEGKLQSRIEDGRRRLYLA